MRRASTSSINGRRAAVVVAGAIEMMSPRRGAPNELGRRPLKAVIDKTAALTARPGCTARRRSFFLTGAEARSRVAGDVFRHARLHGMRARCFDRCRRMSAPSCRLTIRR